MPFTLQSPIGSTVTLNGTTYCGVHFCSGGCGLPAAYIDVEGRRYFMRGSMTAHGPVMQQVPQHPSGPKIDLRTLLSEEDVKNLMSKWWI